MTYRTAFYIYLGNFDFGVGIDFDMWKRFYFEPYKYGINTMIGPIHFTIGWYREEEYKHPCIECEGTGLKHTVADEEDPNCEYCKGEGITK